MAAYKIIGSYIFIISFFIPLPSKSHTITEEEAVIINQNLAKGKRVKITCRGIETKKKKAVVMPSLSSSSLDHSLPVISDEITIDSAARLAWNGKGILEIKAKGNIIFKEGASISNQGKGGLKLVSREGTIQFESPEPQVDFENSEGAISIFYNPRGADHEKYTNPMDFRSHVRIDLRKAFYGAFMLIHNLEDLKNIRTNPQGNYSLNYYLPEISFREFKRMDVPFKGTFNFNGIGFSSRTYYDSYYDHKKQCRVGSFNKHPCIISHIFENCLEEDWGENTFYLSPPLDEDESRLLTSLELSDEEAIRQSIEKIFPWGTDLSAAGKLTFFEGAEKNTPLHIAAERGLVGSLKLMLSKIFEPYKLEHSSPYLRRNPFSLLGRKNADGFRPVDLAVRQGHIKAAGEIISYYHRYNMHFLLGRDLLVSSVRQQEESPLENFAGMLALLDGFQDVPLRFGRLLEGFPINEQAKQEEYSRQLQVGWRFFFRLPGTMRTQQIFREFVNKYNSQDRSFPEFNLEGLSSRSRIILLQAITNHKLQTYCSQNPALKQAYWLDREERIDDENTYIQSVDRFPVIYKFGGLTHTVTNMPTTHKPGFSHYQNIGKYEDICRELMEIEKSISPEKIAKLSRHSRLSGKSITPQKLIDKGYEVREGGNPKEDADYINKINFLLDLENVFRLVKGSQSAWDCLPIPGANARVFSLQRRGVLSLQDLLNKTSPYHPYSDTEGSSQREKAIKGINERFHEVAVERENPYDEEATCISSSIAQWKELHPIGRIIKTPEGLHQEFLEEYGGGYESSGEDY